MRVPCCAVVSDAGAGGQVLMDGPTFERIKEQLEELGAVDHNGLNYAKLHAIRPTWSFWCFGWVGGCAGSCA